MHVHRFLLMIFAVVPLVSQDLEFTTHVDRDPSIARFVYDDIRTFVRAHGLLAERDDTVEVLRTEYLAKGTPGLKMFIEKYDLTPERLARAIARYPADYEALEDMPEWLAQYEPAWRKVFGTMREYIPDIVYPPTYFLVAGHWGINSGSVEGSLISVEKEAANRAKKGDETALLAHELAHFQTGRAVGYETYIEIFNEKKSLLALTIREGIGEFFAKRTAGSYTQDEAEAYVLEHEEELWMKFRKDMHSAETGDWMWQKPSDPEQPWHVAYVLGALIVDSYYEHAPDKAKAVKEILEVTDYDRFLEKSKYGSKFD